jgi:hypothetical protein
VDLNEMKTTYGIQAVNELLDYVLIGGSVDWRLFAIKHGIIKQSTKTVRKSSNSNRYTNTECFYLINGRNQYVFQLHYTNEQLEAFRRGE